MAVYTKPEKTLNQRIEDLVVVMEKMFSWRASFMRGIFQGLGFIIGSTIIAGLGYTLLTKVVSPEALHDISINSLIDKNTK